MSRGDTDRAGTRAARLVGATAPLLVIVVTIAVAVGRMLWTPGFYFADDTQLGAAGIWYELGDNLLRGQIRQFNPQGWQAGNYWAEGQWGLLNPMIWLIGLGVRLAPDVAVAASVVKIVFLAVMAFGAYVLMRSFHASRLWAAVAAILLPQAGFTAFMDAPSWVTGLITTALFPWVWWALRRVQDGRAPWLFLAGSYLLVTVGYVFGTMLLALLLIEALAAAAIRRERGTLFALLPAALWSGLWAVVVYLPGVLTAPVTERGTTEIINSLFLNADLSDMASAAMPIASSTIGAWWGPATAGPLVYIAWILPLVILVRPWSRPQWRGLRTVIVLALAMLALVIGPSEMGPIRWPVRFMPYLALAVLIMSAVLLTRGFPTRVTRRSLLTAALVTIAAGWLSWAQTPAITRSVVLVVVVQLAALGAAYVIAHRRLSWSAERSRRVMAVFAAGIVVITGGLSAYQMRAFPTTPLPTFAVPTSSAKLASVLDDAHGDVMTVGDSLTGAFDARTFDETLVANLWYFSAAKVSNLYTVLPFTAYSKDLCVDLRGGTCAAALSTLLSPDRETGVSVADLLAVSEIVGYRSTFPEPPIDLPSGWRIEAERDLTWRIVRDAAVPSAGGVTWSGSGTRVTEVGRDDTTVTLRVDAVGDDARVVLSRLAWPGYRVDGASFADPVRGYLLTVDLQGASVGSTVTVMFAPPGQPLLIAASAGAVLTGGMWGVVFVIAWARRRRVSAGASPQT